MRRFGEWVRNLLGSETVTTEEVVTSPKEPKIAGDVSLPPSPSLADLDRPPVALPSPTGPSASSAAATIAGVVGASLTYGWISDVGRQRDHNEDSVYVFVSEQFGYTAPLPFGIFLLADGMGGHDAGEVASAVACQTVASQLMEHVYLPLLYGSEKMTGNTATLLSELSDAMSSAIQEANTEVFEGTPGSGTTLTCALIMGSHLLIGHVGDSRAYLRTTRSDVRLVTNDHSLVKQLVDFGQLTPQAAAVHPRRNILYRAVGQGGVLAADMHSEALAPGTQVLLCTDGLWGLVPEEKMWEIVDLAPTLQVACERLVQYANDAGGNDNITVLLIGYRGGAGAAPGDGEVLADRDNVVVAESATD